MAELLLGCGHSRDKRITFPEIEPNWVELTTLDIDSSVKPDVIHNLDNLPYPFENNQFDEIHAYEVLEHCGRQGDFRFFFDQFTELHRILKPGGWLIGTCPNWDNTWAWSDPGHRRIISPDSLAFLSQKTYERCGEKINSVSDYRFCYQVDFEPYHMQEMDNNWGFIMRAIKDGYQPKHN